MNPAEDGPKRPVRAVVVKTLVHRRDDRGMSLEPFASRCVRAGEVHELVTTDHTETAAGARIDRVGFLGFAEVGNAGVLDRGDEVVIGGEVVGTVLGFDGCHFPNHYNVLIHTPVPVTGPDLGLKPEIEIQFRPARRFPKENSMSANRAITFDVALHDGDPVRYPVHAELFLPEGETPESVQVLISGLTYDSRYWTLPGENDYVAHQVRAGRAVLALDRIGTGRSGRPPATEVTVDGNLAVLHQVITALRAGHAGLPAFRRVVAVGHSLGSGLALLEAAEHGDLDGVVVTGLQHRLGPLHDEVAGGLYPAALDPAFEADAAPDGYLTTQPGKRADFYEHPGAVTPELSKWHEETKSTVTLGEGGTLQRIYDPAVPAGVQVPVLLVVGAEDRIFGGGDAATVLAHERQLYAPAARLEVFVLPAAGHALNVHTNAAEWFAAAGAWIDGILR